MAVVTAIWDLALEGSPLGSQGITRGAWATDGCMKQTGHLSSEFNTKDKQTSSLSRALLFGLPSAQSQAYVLGPPVVVQGCFSWALCLEGSILISFPFLDSSLVMTPPSISWA